MKKLISLLFFCLLPVFSFAQQTNIPNDTSLTYNTSVPGVSSTIPLQGIQAEVHVIRWYVSPTPLTTCTFTVDTSPDGGITWQIGNLVPSQPCTTQGLVSPGSTVTSAVRINVTAISGGTVNITYAGFRFRPSMLAALSGAGGAGANMLAGTNLATFTTGVNFGPGGLFTRLSGFGYLFINQSFVVTQTISGILTQGDSGATQGCYATLKSNAGTGTTPTMDIYIQDSADGTNFNDRVHFQQVTTGASSQYAFINADVTPGTLSATGVTAASVGTMATRALAAGSTVSGPIGAVMRLDIVIGGTTPSFTGVSFGLWCN